MGGIGFVAGSMKVRMPLVAGSKRLDTLNSWFINTPTGRSVMHIAMSLSGVEGAVRKFCVFFIRTVSCCCQAFRVSSPSSASSSKTGISPYGPYGSCRQRARAGKRLLQAVNTPNHRTGGSSFDHLFALGTTGGWSIINAVKSCTRDSAARSLDAWRPYGQ